MTTHEPEQIANALVDAAAFGDQAAARRHMVSVRTLRRWRVRMRSDSELAALVRDLVDTHEAELGAMRVRFLRKALAEMEKRLDKADTTLPDIAEAVKVVGELHQVAEVMGHDAGSAAEGEGSPADGDAGESTHVAH